jgi:hypothetical protein
MRISGVLGGCHRRVACFDRVPRGPRRICLVEHVPRRWRA